MDRLKKALSFGGILPTESIAYIASCFKRMDVKASGYFLSLGKVANEIAFVDQGVIRVYSLDKNGEEVTKYFVRQNQFAVDLESYYNMQPSESAFQSILDTRLFVIERKVWNKLSEEVPKLYILTKSLTEATLLNKIKDNDFLNFGTAVDKYTEFLKRYPDLALQVPQQYIASYLKITPQSLSRIRNKLSKIKG